MQFNHCGPGGWTCPGRWASSQSPGPWGGSGGLQQPCCPPWAPPARVLAGPPGPLSGDARRAGPGVPLRWPWQLAAEQVACR